MFPRRPHVALLSACVAVGGASRSGAVGAFFGDDHTHFEAAGARRIADVVAKALRDRQIPLAAF
jgi:hypothetical protein